MSPTIAPGPIRHDEQGFTLIELMISLLLFSFAVAGVLSVAVSVTQGYREQRQAINAEAAVRAPIDFIADAIRQASPGVSDPAKITDYHSCRKGAIVVENYSNAPDELDLFYASGGIVTTLTAEFNATSTQLEVHDGSQLQPGDYVVVTNLTEGFLVKVDSVPDSQTLGISGMCTDTNPTTGLVWPASNFPTGSLVVRAQHAHFEIQDIAGVPTLMMDPDGEPSASGQGGAAPAEPLAENIEDMQIAIGVEDGSAAGLDEIGSAVGDDEWHYNVAGEGSGSSTLTPIRAIRVTLVARTATAQFGNQSTTLYKRPVAEDRAVGAADSYRRRALRSIVELRNIGGSP